MLKKRRVNPSQVVTTSAGDAGSIVTIRTSEPVVNQTLRDLCPFWKKTCCQVLKALGRDCTKTSHEPVPDMLYSFQVII
ncbi:hypothetical protein TNCV_1755161 [Trichonephila clavipes]|nr:hypothetical protein TNCV_1755161 [Trichonephila clavipes]